MPAPTVEYEVHDTPQGRRIYKDEAEASMNRALENLFQLIGAIPAGPQGERGPTGQQGERWIVGGTREYAEGLQCVVGNAVYRRYTAQGLVGLFRCLQPTTTTAQNFPSSAVSNSAWELVLIVPQGDRGPEGQRGQQGIQGARGNDGTSVEVREFTTDAAAQAYSLANPLAIAVSTEGML